MLGGPAGWSLLRLVGGQPSIIWAPVQRGRTNDENPQTAQWPLFTISSPSGPAEFLQTRARAQGSRLGGSRRSSCVHTPGVTGHCPRCPSQVPLPSSLLASRYRRREWMSKETSDSGVPSRVQTPAPVRRKGFVLGSYPPALPPPFLQDRRHFQPLSQRRFLRHRKGNEMAQPH